MPLCNTQITKLYSYFIDESFWLLSKRITVSASVVYTSPQTSELIGKEKLVYLSKKCFYSNHFAQDNNRKRVIRWYRCICGTVR